MHLHAPARAEMPFSRSRLPGLARSLLLAASLGVASATQAHAADRYLRPCQLGYAPTDPKIARLLSRTNQSGAQVELIRVNDGAVVWTGTVPGSVGSWGSFSYVHRVDLSGFTGPGRYRLKLTTTGEESTEFGIGSAYGGADYFGLGAALATFLRAERCGDTEPLFHGPCHLLDAHAIQGGPDSGQPADATGGWHDAGDYIKFLTTEAMTTEMLLWTEEIFPGFAGDANGNGRSDLIDEGLVGARHLLKFRYRPGHFLYQIQDGADHDEPWRLPENDALAAVRPALCGAGRNHLGRLSAALARASRAFRTVDPVLADSCLAAAKDAYASAPAASSIVTNGFYDDTSYGDKMGLGAIELYLATGQASYLTDARHYSDQMGAGSWLGWTPVNGWMNVLLAPYYSTALSRVVDDLDTFRSQADSHPFGMTATETWGVNQVVASAAALALLHERVSGSHKYVPLAYEQRDFLLGVNPWGVCFVSGVGAVSPRDIHSQVGYLANGGTIPGALAEGPAPRATLVDNGIVLALPDEFAEFQADEGVYHDDRNDYVTNEPTIFQNAVTILMAALFAARGPLTEVGNPPAAFDGASLRAWPNPATTSLSVWLQVPPGGAAIVRSVDVIDLRGRRIAHVSLQPGDQGPRGAWDLEDFDGRRVQPGIYWLRTPGAAPVSVVVVK